MSKRVESGLSSARDYPSSPPPPNTPIAKVVRSILSRGPRTAPPSLNSTAISKNGIPQKPFCFKMPLNDSLRPKKPFNISEVQLYMQKGNEAQEIPIAIALYFQAICAIETSQTNIKGLLLKAICYLKSAKLRLGVNDDISHDLKEARLSLEGVIELFNPSNTEADHCEFIYLLGSAFLALYAHSQEEAFLKKAKNFFQKSARLLEREPSKPYFSLKYENQDLLRHRISFGVALSHFYHAKHIICNQGTAETETLLQHLQTSRSSLEKALALQEGDPMSYMLALNHALTAYLIDQKTDEVNLLMVRNLQRKSFEHLYTAIEILKAIPKKNRDVLILLGILKYTLAFSSEDTEGRPLIDLFAAMDAENYLSHAHKMALIEDSSLILCLGDCARKLAWLSQSEFYQSRAQEFVKKASVEGFLGDTLLWVFYTQNDLFKLIDVNSKLQEIDTEAMTNLSENLFVLRSIFKKNSENPFIKRIQPQLMPCVECLENDHLHLTHASKTPEEIKKYAQNVLEIGDKLNQLYAPVLFQLALMERLRTFDLGLELEQDF